MEQESGKFAVKLAGSESFVTIEREAIFLGRLRSCDIRLDHSSVSRIHAGINFLESEYFVINLSTANVMSLNGRMLGPRKTDVLSDGDLIQIGPFLIGVEIRSEELRLIVNRQSLSEHKPRFVPDDQPSPDEIGQEKASVLKVFWEKRTREKEEWGSLLRPTEKPQPGKAAVNWKPTGDLRRPWRVGLFLWAFVAVGAIGLLAFIRYPQAYAEKPLAIPHAVEIERTSLAVTSNANSCTTCHTPNEPIENACIRCHQAEQFHASNTNAHEEAGITCVVCHVQHLGMEFEMKAAATESCAECHNDKNAVAYNGKKVRTPHGGSFGYPVLNGQWIWKGMFREIAETIPAAHASATKGESEQERRSREFHTVHVGRLNAPDGMTADTNGRVSCSSCHTSFTPVDLETPRQTCAACHSAEAAPAANCVSCHVAHPFDVNRWSEFLGEAAVAHRRSVVTDQIKRLNEK